MLELLIAVTILGFLMVLVLNGLHFGARVWEVGRSSSERLGEVETARAFLRNRIESSLPVDRVEGDEDRRTGVEGERDRLRVPVIMPPHLGGGFRLLHVFVERSGVSRNLVVSRERIRLSAGEALVGSAEAASVLIADIEDATFAYYGENTAGTHSWQSAWDGRDAPPQLVRIEVQFRRGDRRSWLPVVVAPMVDGDE